MPTPALTDILQIAIDAGKEILTHYDQPAVVEQKADDSPLTQADHAAHNYIVSHLASLTPDIEIVSEESPEELKQQPRANKFWLVDPLDGTKEFIKKSGEFTVNIALIREGKPILGVVHAPVLNLSYMAEPNRAPFKQETNKSPIVISTIAANPDHLRVVASKDHAGPQVAAMLSRMPSTELLSMGSSLKFCLVAEGRADIYPRFVPTMEWDTAAAQCIVEAAGGTLTDLTGAPLRYGKETLKNPSIITAGDNALDWRKYLG